MINRLDRYVLRHSLWAILLALIVFGFALLTSGFETAMTLCSFAALIGLSISFGELSRHSELQAFQQFGIPIRRVVRSTLLSALVLSIVVAFVYTALRPCERNTECIARYLFALQLPLLIDLAAPLPAISKTETPWAVAAVFLVAYSLLLFVFMAIAHQAQISFSLIMIYPLLSLVAVDVVSYRYVFGPR